ncbi:MAG: hypothetical protein H0T89_05840 [Deltaproteobacteria bacterium]|nr:hypothetical protein [Deltaproteobacteria bacterium]MDQ3301396.1 hypothetical protein [Myxococcota bacterium]
MMMISNSFRMAALGLLAVGGAATADPMKTTKADPLKTAKTTKAPPPPATPAARAAVDKILATWSPRPVLAAQQMLAKYGLPQEATSEQLVWHDQGPYKRITVTRIEIPHDFPKPHMDYLMHTVNYRVSSAKASALVAFDGSVVVDRTAGEMSARCDLEDTTSSH